MSNHIAVYIHLIWTTKNREPLLHKTLPYNLFDHIRVKAVDSDIDICILNGVDDHVHCLVGLRSTQTIAGIVKAIKGESARWLNRQNRIDGLFVWQEGYGAISVSPPDVPRITRYIFNQERHHASRTVKEELEKFALYAQE